MSGRNNAESPVNSAFARRHKLNKAVEFKQVFGTPVVSSDEYFKVLAVANQKKVSRLGMAVSRQIDKRAVGRNRIKRVVRESFRLRSSRNKRCFDVVVLPRRKTATMCNETLFRSLQRHWSKLESQFEG